MTALAAPAKRIQPILHRETSGFIIGPVADAILIIGAPLLALFIAIPLFAVDAQHFMWTILGQKTDIRQGFITAFIEGHLVLVYFRSHGNPQIFRNHPWRFTIIPAALMIGMASSPHLLGIIGVVAVWWDVYHSSLQTFGFGRIYDAKVKNNPSAGRLLDIWMNLFLYTGPVLAGAHFVDHIMHCQNSLTVFAMDQSFLSDLLGRRAPEFLVTHKDYLMVAVLSCGIPFVGYYLFSYYRLQQGGYRVSWQKVWLYIITGSVSIYAWGFRSFFDGFWVMNFFHALQYFAIVVFVEQKNLRSLFRVDRLRSGKFVASFWVVSLCMLYGLWVSTQATGSWMASFAMTTSIMHFWYDGFIWSVKKHQV
jgi:hypothetical protein